MAQRYSLQTHDSAIFAFFSDVGFRVEAGSFRRPTVRWTEFVGVGPTKPDLVRAARRDLSDEVLEDTRERKEIRLSIRET